MIKEYLDILNDIEQEIANTAWKRLEEGRAKVKENPNDNWIDYEQGIIHGMYEARQLILNKIEFLEAIK